VVVQVALPEAGLGAVLQQQERREELLELVASLLAVVLPEVAQQRGLLARPPLLQLPRHDYAPPLLDLLSQSRRADSLGWVSLGPTSPRRIVQHGGQPSRDAPGQGFHQHAALRFERRDTPLSPFACASWSPVGSASSAGPSSVPAARKPLSCAAVVIHTGSTPEPLLLTKKLEDIPMAKPNTRAQKTAMPE